MPDSASLHCPNCGAPAAPNTARCPYCQTRLAAVSCPACFGLMFDGQEFCPHCGARRERQVPGGAAGTCPGCRDTLERVEVGTTTLLECRHCDGVWMDADAFERLCADRDTQAAVLHRVTADGGAPEAAVHYRPCVRCGKLMNRVNFAHISGVVVDVCRGHGTFLDAGELHRIVAFVNGGGLDRMREQQREAFAEEERRLRALQDKSDAVRFDTRGSRHELSFDQLLKELFR
ncbi:MAG TPA: zf-TFIIB domain-containing protein [Vicinamibacterales bacterium]|nr:zf-TFIIB domain-containing protein [Vicinamibacterales bacterium]